MKITRKQLRMLIERELKTILSENKGVAQNRDVAKCVAANEKYAQEHFGRGLTDKERSDTEKACKEDDVVSWYDDENERYAGEKAIKEDSGAKEGEHYRDNEEADKKHLKALEKDIDYDKDHVKDEGQLDEGTATEDMPAEWRQILGNILD